MMRLLYLGALLGLAACNDVQAPTRSEGEAQKIKMDMATKEYAECISEKSAEANVDNDAAGSIANRVVLLCKDLRNTLMADVIAFHQIGHPKFSIAQSKAVAEASIATIEDELRRETVVGIVSRQIAGRSASDADAASANKASENFTGRGKTGL